MHKWVRLAKWETVLSNDVQHSLARVDRGQSLVRSDFTAQEVPADQVSESSADVHRETDLLIAVCHRFQSRLPSYRNIDRSLVRNAAVACWSTLKSPATSIKTTA